MDVSIVIPAFDAAATLAQTVESALAQEGLEREVIVIDDGSRDATLEIARAFEPRAKVRSGANAGVSAARNRGIAESTGEFLLFLDADDLLCAGTLRQRLERARHVDADVVICDWRDGIDGTDGLELGPRRSVDREALSRDAEVACASHVWATTAAILYRRDVVERVGGFRRDLPVIQDARLLFDVARAGARFAFCEHVGATYRIVANSLSRRNPARFWADVARNGEQIAQLWASDGPLTPARRRVLAGIFDNAARGLLAAGAPEYLHVVGQMAAVGEPMPLHPRVAAPLARVFGVARARQVLSWVGR